MAVSAISILLSTGAIRPGDGGLGFVPIMHSHFGFIIFGFGLWALIDAIYLGVEWWVESRPLLRLTDKEVAEREALLWKIGVTVQGLGDHRSYVDAVARLTNFDRVVRDPFGPGDIVQVEGTEEVLQSISEALRRELGATDDDPRLDLLAALGPTIAANFEAAARREAARQINRCTIVERFWDPRSIAMGREIFSEYQSALPGLKADLHEIQAVLKRQNRVAKRYPAFQFNRVFMFNLALPLGLAFTAELHFLGHWLPLLPSLPSLFS